MKIPNIAKVLRKAPDVFFGARTLRRFVILHFSERVMRRRPVFDLCPGVQMVARRDFGSPALAYYVGLYEPASMHFLLAFLREADHFVDVGANVGIYTLLAAGGCKATVDAFEPVSAAADGFQENVRLNGLDGLVKLHAIALGSARGRGMITTGLSGSNHLTEEARAGTREVEIDRLDDRLARTPAAIKLDVEGHEAEVLRGATRTLQDDVLQAVILECLERTDEQRRNSAAAARVLVDAGFQCVTYDPACRKLTPTTGLQKVGGNEDNCLFVRNVRVVSDRLHKRDSERDRGAPVRPALTQRPANPEPARPADRPLERTRGVLGVEWHLRG